MPRIQIIICSGVCFFISTVTTAQSIPGKNSSIQQVISYYVYQQKQWNYHQLPKNSIQYKLDPKYIPLTGKQVSSIKMNLSPVSAPRIKRNCPELYFHFPRHSKSYLQNSRFLKYIYPNNLVKGSCL